MLLMVAPNGETAYIPPDKVAANEANGERKHAILFAATLLCARKLIETIESDKPNFAKQFFIDRAIEEVEFVMERTDAKWPAESGTLKE